MTRVATCQDCGARFKVPDSVTAKKSKCSKCGGVVEIPPVGGTSDAPSAAAAPAAKPPRAARPAAARKPSVAPARAAKPARTAAAPAVKKAGGKPAVTRASGGKAAGGKSAAAKSGRARSGAKSGARGSKGRSRGGASSKSGGGSSSMMLWIVIVVLLLGGGGAWWWLTQPEENASTDSTTASSSEAAAEDATAEGSDNESATDSADSANSTDSADDAVALVDDKAQAPAAQAPAAQAPAAADADAGSTEQAPAPAADAGALSDSEPLPTVLSFEALPPVLGSTQEQVDEWTETIKEYYFNPLLGQRDRKRLRPKIDELDGVDMIPAMFAALEGLDVDDSQAVVSLGSMLIEWKDKTAGKPTFGFNGTAGARSILDNNKRVTVLTNLYNYWVNTRGSGQDPTLLEDYRQDIADSRLINDADG
ncbi:MAG: hypothetical protein DHS20C15_02900 [Planctomycetota bacterium]|nr:MAG: hypothetical protein DHS20C15_02900 [Planctomycetota bacterium]